MSKQSSLGRSLRLALALAVVGGVCFAGWFSGCVAKEQA